MHSTSSLTPPADVSRRTVILAGLLLVLAGLAAYHNTFSVPFVFDDLPSIKENASIRQLWPIGPILSPAPNSTVGGRPIVNLTLAINYAISGDAVWSYHALNLAIHLLVGLGLFGVVRRTLTQPVLRARFGEAALPLAAAITALWLLHPLQTESVTYIIQRAESLVGLFCLLTLYGFIRATGSPPGTTQSRAWFVFSFTTCLLGMATKEVMVSAPLLVLAYDWIFVSSRETGGFRAVWRQRRRYYLALTATWIVLAVLVASTRNRGGTAGLDTGVSPMNYALTQCQAIALYLKLAFWPHPLVIDYGVDVIERVTDVWPQAVLLVLLFAGPALALWRRSPIGFVGLWFFALLAPSSSLVPIASQTMTEHRMYLPLAAIIAVIVLGLHARRGRRSLWLWPMLVLVLGWLTVQRNETYRSDETL